MKQEQYDIIIVGGGHAGCEAAHICSTMGMKSLLITSDITKIGEMSCNPSIGGIGKGQLVREVSALGGCIAEITDQSTIQFRMLNASKGPAMHSPRAQCDRVLFSQLWRRYLSQCANLTIIQESVEKILMDTSSSRCLGVQTRYRGKIYAHSTILACGTFLNGLIHVGLTNQPGGRIDEPSIDGLSAQLETLGLIRKRFKTGTSPRVDLRSINLNILEKQYSDAEPYLFSVWDEPLYYKLPHRPCYITHTNSQCHEILRSNLHVSPLYSHIIQSRGPRYCPSIEDKIHVFATKESHQVFIEPEGLHTHMAYLNGFSSSLPYAVQEQALKCIKGFENIQIMRTGYAIEYDCFDPTQLELTLESKIISCLFIAGQLNGTTGYEEAAAQGIIAGINASLQCMNKKPFIIYRNESYIGVMLDDLTSRGVDEPYRMFTSRAENRIKLRQDNADIRLLQYSYQYNLINKKQYKQIKNKYNQLDNLLEYCNHQSLTPTQINPYLLSIQSSPIKQKTKLINLIKRPEIRCINLFKYLNYNIPLKYYYQWKTLCNNLDIYIKYAHYIKREKDIHYKIETSENISFNWKEILKSKDYLSKELQDKINRYKPNSLKELQTIPGIKPSDLQVILIIMKTHKTTHHDKSRS